jgi:hypothetical protein
MQGRALGKNYWVRVPICLLCSLDDIKLHRSRGNDGWYDDPHWHRTRCLNCGRPIRLHSWRWYLERWSPSLNAQTCCADCERLAKNRRNRLRRRVEHVPRTCANPACGKTFIPGRDDAVTCSNRCRQALHRERQRAELGGGNHPLRKPPPRRERRPPQ